MDDMCLQWGAAAESSEWLEGCLSRPEGSGCPGFAQIMADRLGNLLNKEAVLMAIHGDSLPASLQHIKSFKKVRCWHSRSSLDAHETTVKRTCRRT